ncbi:hypothetical protein BD410DRAFT_830603 [Rickenella mellea]|uniref:OPT superfamily oligopeptide transporter n=1 Tax=Rickenella mellea TaxID=50990 RepID=A0A4Y7PVF4_9AGAM|nr:hypothetical protein BD410DRAFT_830603 [Rickenella mellea]
MALTEVGLPALTGSAIAQHLHCHWRKDYTYSAWVSAGVTSPVLTTVIVGVLSQVWLRRCGPVWFIQYNYILRAQLDCGSQVMIFVLSFALFGASGISHRFPNWAGNPRKGNIDHCNGNHA